MGVSNSDLLARIEVLKLVNLAENNTKVTNDISLIQKQLDGVRQVNVDKIKELGDTLTASLTDFQNEHSSIITKLEDHIHKNVAEFIEISNEIYEDNYQKMSFKEHFKTISKWPQSNRVNNEFKTVIKKLVDWRTPSLIFGASGNDIITTMLGSEPIYSLEMYKEYFDLQKQFFSDAKKLRFYTLDEKHLLPKENIGLIVVYNRFNFLSHDIVKDNILLFESLLMPGGQILFNFNDCSKSKNYKLFERRKMIYSNLDMFVEIFESINMELVEYYSFEEDNFSYAVFRKKGSTRLIKRHPSYGVISPIHQPQRLRREDN